MPAARTTTYMSSREFRNRDSYSGTVHIYTGSHSREGAHRRHGRASCNSLEHRAGTDAVRFAAAGESAPTSAAHAASCETDAVLADSKANDAACAPKNKNSKPQQQKPNHAEHATLNGDTAAQETPSKPKSNASKGSGSGGDPPIDPVEELFLERSLLDGGDPLPLNAQGFVDSVNAHIDMVRTTELLLRGRDEKSTKSLIELLLELKYGQKPQAASTKMQSPLDRLPPALRE